MTSRELRKQRLDEPAIPSEAKTHEGEADRKARKLEYQQSRAAADSARETCGVGSLAGEPVFTPGERSSSALAPSERSSSPLALNPELFDEFSAGEQAEMAAIRARVHTGVSTAPVAVERKPGATGPTTPEGKATSSGNSLKHGLASGRVIIPGEDPAEFEALLSDLVNEHAPANETESLLVQQMAQSWWLMQRAIRIQNQAFTETRIDTHKLALFLRYQTTYERAFYRALNTLLKLSRDREGAVSVRRKPAPEFVSQRNPQTAHENGFVSQNRPHTPLPNQFVSQRSSPTAILQADR